MIILIKQIWKDPVWSKIIATIILALFGSTYFLDVWPPIKEILDQIWLFIQSSTSVPNWLLAMIFPCFLLLIKLKEWFGGNGSDAAFKNYTKDHFFGLLWVWRYSGNKIDNLHSVCPHCYSQILPKVVNPYTSRHGYKYMCDDCGYSADAIECDPDRLHQKIELKIGKALRTGEWTKKENG